MKKTEPKSCNETIHENGFRFTAQRREVFDALMAKRDHPTAVEVFMRVKEKMPSISLATVYNCLETLTECNLVKHVNLDRAPSRYCANLEPHGHFFCTECGSVIDVPLPKDEKKFGGNMGTSRAILRRHAPRRSRFPRPLPRLRGPKHHFKNQIKSHEFISHQGSAR